MYSDLIEENFRLQTRIFELENAITQHSQLQFVTRATTHDEELWATIGLHPYTEDEKNVLQAKALRMETEAQKRGEGSI